MKKAAANKTTDADDVEETLRRITAKKMFYGATMNMGWRLAVAVLLPVVGGVKLDEWLGSSPSFTLLGVMIAAVAASVVVWGVVKDVNQEQAEMEQQDNNNRGNSA